MNKEDQESLIATEEINLRKHWELRNLKMLQDRYLVNLIRPEKKSDTPNWVTNEPKVFFDTSRAICSINEPRFRLPISMNFEAEEKQKMNKAERLCIGIWRSLNQSMIDRGSVSWLWDLAYWVLLGWYAVFAVTKKCDNGETEFVADIWDAYNVYPMWDNRELIRCIRSYEVDRVTAIGMAENMVKLLGGEFKEPTDDGTKQKIVNYWKLEYTNNKPKVYNAITIAGQLVKPMTLQTGMRRIPIHVGAIGSPDKLFDNWMTRQGESIVAANEDVYEYMNVMLRLLAEIMAETAYPTIVGKSRTGQGLLRNRKFGHGQTIETKIEDSIEILKHAASPQELEQLVAYFQSQTQKGSIPNVVYGGLGGAELSGFAISQLLAAVKYKLSPYLNAIQSIVSRMMTDLLVQYKSGDFKPITLSTLDPYSVRRGMAYFEEFTREDVPDRTYVEVTIPIQSQFDKTQTIQNSIAALQSGLMSRETLWETELDIQDVEQERERIRDDQVSQDPFVLGIEIINGMWRKYEELQLTNPAHAAAMKRYIQLKEMELGLRQGMVQAPNQGNPSPEQLPPEMWQVPNPDQRRAMANNPPPSPNRATQGETRLYGTGGETLI